MMANKMRRSFLVVMGERKGKDGKQGKEGRGPQGCLPLAGWPCLLRTHCTDGALVWQGMGEGREGKATDCADGTDGEEGKEGEATDCADGTEEGLTSQRASTMIVSQQGLPRTDSAAEALISSARTDWLWP